MSREDLEEILKHRRKVYGEAHDAYTEWAGQVVAMDSPEQRAANMTKQLKQAWDRHMEKPDSEERIVWMQDCIHRATLLDLMRKVHETETEIEVSSTECPECGHLIE